MKSNYKRCAVVFNMDNQMQRDLYNWCMTQSTNFSEFTRTILYLHRQSNNPSRGIEPLETPRLKTNNISSHEDSKAMTDLL